MDRSVLPLDGFDDPNPPVGPDALPLVEAQESISSPAQWDLADPFCDCTICNRLGPIDIYRDNSRMAQICEYISSFYIFVQLCLISLIISCALVCFLCILHIHNFFSIIPVDLRNISIFKFLISLKFCGFLDLNELKRFDFDLPASFWIGIWILILIMVFISSDCYLFYGFDKFLVRPKFAPLLDLRKRIKRADQCLIWISCKIQFI